MIRHIVLMKFENPQDAQQAQTLLRSLEGSSQDLQAITAELDFVHAAASYDLFLEMDFQDRQAQQNFQHHPVHEVVRAKLKQYPKTSVKVDFWAKDEA